MKKLFISQPMKGKTKEEILQERDSALNLAKDLYGEDFKLIDSYIEKVPKNVDESLWCLGRSLQMMAEADFVYFANGWENARGCKIEHICAGDYYKDFATDESDCIALHLQYMKEKNEVEV